ncbi:MAG: endonuclease/exonuclease/phosphatase family protein [Bacteroidetes bacterium]|nr:endonuclease/exonuclease/phosphatase family protein [Bacteroidota bacterium]
MLITLAVLTGLLVFFTILPLWRCEVWWVRGWDFPRFQLFTFGLFLVAGGLFVLDLSRTSGWLIIGANLICMLYHGWWIVPYTNLYPAEVVRAKNFKTDCSIRIMSANVLTPNRQVDRLLALVRENDPDILVTLESDKWWEERLDVLEPDYPHTIKCPLDNLYGMHVYSRLPLKDPAIQFLVEPDVPSMHALVVLPSGKKVRIHFLHPAPPSPTENEESSERDAELLVVGKSVADTDEAVIVAGDLNDVAWSATTRLFRKVSGLLDPRIGRAMINTFNANYWFIRWPLDHIFHSHHFTLSFIKRLPYFGSDHFPVLVELVHDVVNGSQQEGLEADEDDHEWAEEKIEAEGVRKEDVHLPGK